MYKLCVCVVGYFQHFPAPISGRSRGCSGFLGDFLCFFSPFLKLSFLMLTACSGAPGGLIVQPLKKAEERGLEGDDAIQAAFEENVAAGH